jgi:hypothetical protein
MISAIPIKLLENRGVDDEPAMLLISPRATLHHKNTVTAAMRVRRETSGTS